MNIDISKFNQTHLLVIGDLMIDEYVWGEVERISPEAPVQVVAVQNHDYALGGSGNVINNLVSQINFIQLLLNPRQTPDQLLDPVHI